jgi:hypothetical protein
MSISYSAYAAVQGSLSGGLFAKAAVQSSAISDKMRAGEQDE